MKAAEARWANQEASARKGGENNIGEPSCGAETQKSAEDVAGTMEDPKVTAPTSSHPDVNPQA